MNMSEKSALELNQELGCELTTERGHTIKTIFLVAEMERRELFVELGYGSMWDFLRRVHRQSDTMIHYRLRCARDVRVYRRRRFAARKQARCRGSEEERGERMGRQRVQVLESLRSVAA